ncbi:AAA family ATPase [Exiguobacterium sp. s59]|uniref:AAA family ATPase n=1 Tax=Exiguobacterium sp. s59 TaxID=2751269 RepID=UPI001BE767BD|nr:AAA family ATPase [Exiguobacterium sp. s59]
MIIWINGAFGSGKTTCAKILEKQLPNAFLYDPEQAGFFIRDQLPKSLQQPDFQHHPEWREFNYQMLLKIATSFDGVILVPMTLVNATYVDEIIGRLQRDGIDVRHLILEANRRTLVRRLNKRFEWFNSWGKSQIDRCQSAFQSEIHATKIVTNHRSKQDVARAVAEHVGLTLSSK